MTNITVFQCIPSYKPAEVSRLIIFFMILGSFTGLYSQDSLIRVQLTRTFLICNPPPQYVVEVKSDMTISFYNILPENLSLHQLELLGDYILDSTTLAIDSADFNVFEKSILALDLDNINSYKKRKSENGIVAEKVDGPLETYIIETSDKTSKFDLNGIPKEEQLIPFKTIRILIEELEEKYKP